jgi:hypothetical protein
VAKAKKGPQKGKVPAHLRPYLFGNKQKGSGNVAKKKAVRRKSAGTSGGGRGHRRRSGGGGMFGGGGLFNGPMVATVGGATAASFLGPKIIERLPENLRTTGSIIGPAVAGLGGGWLIAKMTGNKQLAAGFAAGIIGPSIGAMLGSLGAKAQMKGLGFVGNPGGQDYLPNDLEGMGGDDDLEGLAGDDDDLEGLGAYEPETVEIVG